MVNEGQTLGLEEEVAVVDDAPGPVLRRLLAEQARARRPHSHLLQSPLLSGLGIQKGKGRGVTSRG